MANEVHLAKLKEGVDAWNDWRSKNQRLRPDLSGARIKRANLRRANLKRVNLSGTNLRGADLTQAKLRAADLSDSDLTHVQGLELDSNRILQTRFSPRARDKWSILRRIYTGPNMVLNLIFMLIFFAPLVVKGGGFAILSETQQRVIESANLIDGYKLSVTCNKPQGAIAGAIHGVEVRLPCRSEPMWRLLLGFGGPLGMVMPILTAVLIAYQITRYLLTRQISLMRDAEERSGVSPSLGEPGEWWTYPSLYRIHQGLTVVAWIGVFAFFFRAFEFLFLSEVIFMVGSH